MNMTILASRIHPRTDSLEQAMDEEHDLFPDKQFHRLFVREKKRIERSEKKLILMLLDIAKFTVEDWHHGIAEKILGVIFSQSRDTDLKGWYKQGTVLGVLFTEVSEAGDTRLVEDKMREGLRAALPPEAARKIVLSVHLFPDDGRERRDGGPAGARPDLEPPVPRRKKLSLLLKRGMDIVGALAGLGFSLPLMALIALAIKLTSRGPVFFRQQRVGWRGRPFTFLKFRSMRTDNDPRIHQEYVRSLIQGNAAAGSAASGEKVFKIARDPRVTAVGRFIRKTSLDELPQFINVLLGDMSLVGPRPPVPYEYDSYFTWHRRRVLDIRPGITGLWQVEGRSRTTFDEMVRLDLKYGREWSLWLDLRILARTPLAMFRGAY